ncbi:hypothetical protein FOL47_006906 [Perkinsus chesapeaki]|uniref:Uncharacterized protein n=1 Tax=Perkinsus chesapeaki TaxID=330153 RepID=A0A7J6LP64_PERCH|nr:hypothetical protein FOL47_006906 [Perkinsus chesapeaki]
MMRDDRGGGATAPVGVGGGGRSLPSRDKSASSSSSRSSSSSSSRVPPEGNGRPPPPPAGSGGRITLTAAAAPQVAPVVTSPPHNDTYERRRQIQEDYAYFVKNTYSRQCKEEDQDTAHAAAAVIVVEEEEDTPKETLIELGQLGHNAFNLVVYHTYLAHAWNDDVTIKLKDWYNEVGRLYFPSIAAMNDYVWAVFSKGRQFHLFVEETMPAATAAGGMSSSDLLLKQIDGRLRELVGLIDRMHEELITGSDAVTEKPSISEEDPKVTGRLNDLSEKLSNLILSYTTAVNGLRKELYELCAEDSRIAEKTSTSINSDALRAAALSVIHKPVGRGFDPRPVASDRGSSISSPPSAVTYKNLISLLLPTAQEYHNIKKRKQDDAEEGGATETGKSGRRSVRRPAVAALDTELGWQPGIRTHSPKTPTPPTLHFRESKGKSEGKVLSTTSFRESLAPPTKEALRTLQLFRGFCICNFTALRLVTDISGRRPAVRVPITRSRHIELLLEAQMPLKGINIKGETNRITIGTLWLLMASRSLTSQSDLQRHQRLVRDIAEKFNLDVLDSAKERQLLLAYLTGRSGIETIVRSSLWSPIEEGRSGMENGDKEHDAKKARLDPGDSCSLRAEAVGRRIVIEEKLSTLNEQLKEAHKQQQQQQATAAAAKANPAISRAVAALVQKTRIQAAVSSGYRADVEGDGIAPPETPSSSGQEDEMRTEKAIPLITSDVVAAVSSDNPELIALEIELEAKLQLQKQILIEYYRVSDMLRMERELVTCYQRRGKHLEIEKTKALTMLLEHTKGAEVDADLKQCQLAVTPRTLKAQDDRMAHRQDSLTVQSLHM